MDAWAWSALGVLTLFALVMRFWRLGDVPPGLFYDEAFNGLDAYGLVSTPLWDWPLFFTGNHGREPLYLWLMAIAHAFFGPSTWTIRLIPALCGALLTPAMAWLGWEVAPMLGGRHRRAFALWSGAVILAMLWSQIFSRYGIRLSLFVLLETLLWASLWRAWQQTPGTNRRSLIRHGRWWMLAGLFAGLSFYTYLPARLLPLILAPMAAIALGRHRSQLMAHGRGIVLGGLVALIVAAPLGIYFIQNPVSFTTRVGQVSVIGHEEGGVLANLAPVAAMFAWTGDHNPRSNLPFRPALDLLMAPFFFAGLAVALWRFWQLARVWLLAGLFVMLLPTLLSEFAPNFQRAIGALPFVAILIVLGMEGIVRLGERIAGGGRRLYLALGSTLIALSIVLTWRAYFVTWAGSPDLFPAWDVGFTRIAAALAENDAAGRVYISPRGQAHPTIAYLLENHPDVAIPDGFDGRICMRVATDGPAQYYFLDNEDSRSKALLDSYYPEATTGTVVWDTLGQPWADKLVQPAGGAVRFPELVDHTASLSDGIDLLGYWYYPADGFRAGEPLYTRFYWQVNARPRQNYTAFSHLLHIDGSGAVTQIAGSDRPPGEGTCPTGNWLPGEVVVDELQFVIPAEFSPAAGGAYYLEIGFYTPEDGRRLDVPGNSDDRILIGPISAQP